MQPTYGLPKVHFRYLEPIRGYSQISNTGVLITGGLCLEDVTSFTSPRAFEETIDPFNLKFTQKKPQSNKLHNTIFQQLGQSRLNVTLIHKLADFLFTITR